MISIQSNSPGYASKECCSYLGQLLIFLLPTELGIGRPERLCQYCGLLFSSSSPSLSLLCPIRRRPPTSLHPRQTAEYSCGYRTSLIFSTWLPRLSAGCLSFPCLHAVRSLFYLLRVRFMYDMCTYGKSTVLR